MVPADAAGLAAMVLQAAGCGQCRQWATRVGGAGRQQLERRSRRQRRLGMSGGGAAWLAGWLACPEALTS